MIAGFAETQTISKVTRTIRDHLIFAEAIGKQERAKKTKRNWILISCCSDLIAPPNDP
jgi:hypothetical protein